jgi:hypothetical protein
MTPAKKEPSEKSLGNEHDSSLLELSEHLFGDGTFVSDEIKKQFISGVVQKSVATGSNRFLQSTSPSAKILKQAVSATMQHVAEPKHESIINGMVEQYMTHKQSQSKLMSSKQNILLPSMKAAGTATKADPPRFHPQVLLLFYQAMNPNCTFLARLHYLRRMSNCPKEAHQD